MTAHRPASFAGSRSAVTNTPAQLQPADVDGEAAEAVENWRYWAAQGYWF